MARRKQGIQWTAKQKALLARTVKNFNAKLTREELKAKKKGNYAEVVNYLPSHIRQDDLKRFIRTAQDLKKVTGIYARFSKAGAADKVKDMDVTRWQYNEARRLQKQRNKQTAELQETYDRFKGNSARARDEGIAYSKTDLSKKNRRQTERFIVSMLGFTTDAGRYRKEEQYRQNFIAHVNSLEGINERELRLIKQFLKSVTPDALTKMWYKSDILHIGFLYPPPGEEQSVAETFVEEMLVMIKEMESEGETVFNSKFEEFRGRKANNGKSMEELLKGFRG